MSEFYIYIARVDGEIRYIGKGKGFRYLHCSSGISSCYELNRDHFLKRDIQVNIIIEKLTEERAIQLEAVAIDMFDNLYNKSRPKKSNSHTNNKNDVKTIKGAFLNSKMQNKKIEESEIDFLMNNMIKLRNENKKIKNKMIKLKKQITQENSDIQTIYL